MKIGILTLPFNNNYGGYLQAYALMTVLKQMGHEVELIYRRNNRRSLRWRIKTIIKNTIKLSFGRKIGNYIPNQETEHRHRGHLMMSFVDKRIIPRTSPIYSTKEMYRKIRERKYDLIVIGSDQVWRPDYGQGYVQDFFLSEQTSILPVRIAYAASFGTSNMFFSKQERDECGKAISKFRAVSVREHSGLDLIKRYGWDLICEPIVVLDPTLLLSRDHYLSLLDNRCFESKDKIFCYILDKAEETMTVINAVERIVKAAPYYAIDVEKWENSNYVMPSIESWLKGIRDSKMVVTDSYHGMVFSIIMHKTFVVKVNKTRGSDRFYTLLSILGLESRSVNDEHSILTALNTDIDWAYVQTKLNNEIKKSYTFLINNIQ